MRLKMALLVLFFTVAAMATTLDDACDLLRADPEVRLPNMTDQECRRHFRIQGARQYVLDHQERVLKRQSRVALRAALLANQEAVDSGIPLPAPGPTPTATPTATTTASSTPTSTSTATATPTPTP